MSEHNEMPGEGNSTERMYGAGVNDRDQGEQWQDQAREYADKAKEKAGEYGDVAHDRLQQGRVQAASGVRSAAQTIRQRVSDSGGVTAAAGTKVADSMETAAAYLREHDTNEMLEDFEDYAKKHPAQALVGAILAGFLLGRMLR